MSHFTNDPDPLGHTRDERGDDDGACRSSDAAAGVPVTCWRCTHPATCVDNGFCSIERRDLEDLP